MVVAIIIINGAYQLDPIARLVEICGLSEDCGFARVTVSSHQIARDSRFAIRDLVWYKSERLFQFKVSIEFSIPQVQSKTNKQTKPTK